jgi:hypothetical protein
MGIVFDSRRGPCSFTEPTPFPNLQSDWSGAGIYTILVTDGRCYPKQFRPIYFGETVDFRQRLTIKHEHFADWQTHGTLYVALSFMPSSTKQQRLEVESALIDMYTPSSNQTGLAATAASLRYRGSSKVPSPQSVSSAMLPRYRGLHEQAKE